MDTQTLVSVITPLVIGLLMWGLGLSLTWADFSRVRSAKKTVATALFVQILVLPGIALLLCWLFNLNEPMALGLLLLAATPGGTLANLHSFIAKGNVTLNVTMTAINSLIAVFTLPAIAYFGAKYFQNTDTAVPLQISKFVQVIGLMLIPMAIGMDMRKRKPGLAKFCEKYVGKAAGLFIVILLVTGLTKEWPSIRAGLGTVGAALIAFNLISLGFGFVTSRWLHLSRPDSIAVTMELGVHNSLLAIGLAMNPALLNSPESAVPASIYSALMHLTALPLALWLGSHRARAEAVQ